MKLADAQDVLEKIGTSSHADSTLLAESGLEFATNVLETVLDTPLGRSVVQDYFSFTPGKYHVSSDFVTLQLVASRGFWDKTEDVKVYFSETGSILPDDLSALTEIDSSLYSVNHEQGMLTLTTEPYMGVDTVAVAYTSGFEEGGSNIPHWLKIAAVGYAIQNMNLHGIGFNKKDIADKSKEQGRIAYASVCQHIRTRHHTQARRTVLL